MPDVLSREQLEERVRLLGGYMDATDGGTSDMADELEALTTALHYLKERDEARELLVGRCRDCTAQNRCGTCPVTAFLAKTGGQE
ncbi:MAG: hypothetical protein WC322_06960 [Candidatus Paceibacterota bacterium]